MVIMIKEKKFVRRRALKVLDYALNGNVTNCERFVEILGLKTLFSVFMKKSKGVKAHEEKEDEEHAVCCITHLLKTVSGEERKRLLHKFIEDDHAKVDRLVELHLNYTQRVSGITISGYGNDEEDAANAAYLERLDAGLYVLQLTDFILATVATEGRRSARERVHMLMELRDIPMSRICDTLKEYMENLEDGSEGELEILKRLIKDITAPPGTPEGAPEGMDAEEGAPTPPQGATPDATPPGSPSALGATPPGSPGVGDPVD
jgi:beta-catenin-like protein 1